VWHACRVAIDFNLKQKGINMPKYRILRNYLEMNDAPLGDFGLHIGTCMTGNANFTTPPVTGAALTGLGNTYITTLAAAVDGNKLATANKLAAQSALLAALDQTADYVELTSQNNQAKLLSSGFTLASTSHAQAQVGTTGILSVSNLATTKLELELQVADNAWCYVVQISTAPNVWTTAGVFTNPHDVVLTGLTPGTTYAIRVCAMGSGNQQSEWSDVVNHMST
jgi:hypothetical protein